MMSVVNCQLSVVSRKFVPRTTDHGPRTGFARSGLSLTEVLIAMGILTLGLLGVASVFPVASFYMQSAEISDVSSAVAQDAMNELVARGMLDPWAWFVFTPSGKINSPIGTPNYLFTGIDGAYAPSGAVKQNSYTRPFAETLEAGKSMLPGAVPTASIPVILAKQFGSAYVIDPIGIAAPQVRQGPNLSGRIMYGFPSASFMTYPVTGGTYYSHSAWDPWRSTGSIKPPNYADQMTWPIRRVTFRQSNTGWNLDKQMAEYYFQFRSDLSYDFPERDDRPAIQLWDIDQNNRPLARKWKGDYSWIATVAPSTSDARDLMSSSPGSVTCDVSVVVLYKRSLPSDSLVSAPDYAEAVMPERSVGASILSTGLNGGELLLRDLGDGVSSAFKHLKAHQWIMLCGPHPNSSESAPRFVLNWYQVVSIESQENSIITDSTKQRIVTVRGVQWPWQPAMNGPKDYSKLSNDLCVGIIKGAVAVHTKSIALQDSRRGGIASFGSTGSPTNTKEQNQPH